MFCRNELVYKIGHVRILLGAHYYVAVLHMSLLIKDSPRVFEILKLWTQGQLC
jgi:hypothetical protein